MSFTFGFVNFADKMAWRSDWVDWRRGMANSSFSERIIELDGLRGMAILFVLLFHYVADQGVWMDVGPSVAPGGLLSHFQRLFPTGWAGVDLFFVLSGFLVGGILLDARHCGISAHSARGASTGSSRCIVSGFERISY